MFCYVKFWTKNRSLKKQCSTLNRFNKEIINNILNFDFYFDSLAKFKNIVMNSSLTTYCTFLLWIFFLVYYQT